jgi:hypothetical protein
MLLAALRTNQKYPAARGRHQLSNVGHVRHDDSPDDGAQKLFYESKGVYQTNKVAVQTRALIQTNICESRYLSLPNERMR